MKPLTLQEKAQDLLPDLLSDAAKARTESIKLSSVPYAKELSDQLLAHASKLEGYYRSLKNALEDKEPEKQLKSLVQKITEANVFTEKAQAWWQSDGSVFRFEGLRANEVYKSLQIVNTCLVPTKHSSFKTDVQNQSVFIRPQYIYI